MKREELKKEFPFLKEFEEENVTIERIDENLLNSVGYHCITITGIDKVVAEFYVIYYIIISFDYSPKEYKVFKVPYKIGHNNPYGCEGKGISISDYILKFISPEEILGIIKKQKIFDRSMGTDFQHLTLYLPPKDVSGLSIYFKKKREEMLQKTQINQEGEI